MAELAALRLLLAGESVVDLPRLWFGDRAAVDAFLRLQEFDTDNPLDVSRLNEIHEDAVVYLRDAQGYRLPKEVEDPAEVHDLFLFASQGAPRLRRFACMTLKVMHIMHHLAGRELVFNTPISEAQLLDRLSGKVFHVIDRMRASGIGVQEFAAGQKSRASLVSKLLAKRSNLASQIYDKLRFRVIVKSRDDLVHALSYFVHHLFPFNYVIPEQSQNGILTPSDLSRALGVAPELVERFWAVASSGERDAAAAGQNEFSGRSYRSVNFVADIPLRIDDLAPESAPAVVFAQSEIQMVDAETAKANERGDNNHALYKKRQSVRVRLRLEGPEAAALDVASMGQAEPPAPEPTDGDES